MTGFIVLLRREPAMVSSVAQAALSLAVTLGLHLTAGQAGAVEAAAAGVAAVIVAASTRPVAVPVLTGGLTAILTCLTAFGVPHITAPVVSAINVAVLAVLGSALRAHQTPITPTPTAAPQVVR